MISDEKPKAEDVTGEARRVSVLKKLVGLRRNEAVAFLSKKQANPLNSPVWWNDLSRTLTILGCYEKVETAGGVVGLELDTVFCP